MKILMKRIVALALVLCMAMAMVVIAHAEGTPSASLSLSGEISGEQVIVYVMINDCNDACGIQVDLNFDSSKVSYNSANKGGVSFDGFDAGSAGSTVSLVFGPGGDNLSGQSGTLASVTFDINSDAVGDASFSLSNGKVGNTDGVKGAVSYGGSYSVRVREPIYDITIDTATKNGKITKVDPNSSERGKTIKVTVEPDSGYVCTGVTATGAEVSGSGETWTFTMPDNDVTVSATFGLKSYAVKVNSATGGKVTANVSSAKKGDTVTLTVTPNDGYGVGKVSVTGAEVSGSGSTYTFTMPAQDVTVSATFNAKSYNITKEEVAHAKIEVSTTAKTGETVTVKVTPDSGYEVTGVTVNGTAATKKDANTYTFTMPAKDVKVSATVAAKTYKVTTGSITNGTIKVNTSTAKVGDKITITVTPKDGYEVDKVTFNGSAATKNQDGTYSFTMPAKDVTVTATINAKTYGITKDVGSNGKVENLDSSAKTGETVTIKVTPNSGYKVGKVSVSDAAVSANGNTYTFTMPAKAVKVTVTFEKKAESNNNNNKPTTATTAATTATTATTTKATTKATTEATTEATTASTTAPTTAPTTEATTEATTAPTTEATTAPTTDGPTNGTVKNGVPVWIWILLLLLLLIIGGSVGYYIYRRNKK